MGAAAIVFKNCIDWYDNGVPVDVELTGVSTPLLDNLSFVINWVLAVIVGASTEVTAVTAAENAVVASVIVKTLLLVFTIVAPLPNVKSLPVTVKSPERIVDASVIVSVLASVLTIVQPLPNVKSPSICRLPVLANFNLSVSVPFTDVEIAKYESRVFTSLTNQSFSVPKVIRPEFSTAGVEPSYAHWLNAIEVSVPSISAAFPLLWRDNNVVFAFTVPTFWNAPPPAAHSKSPLLI